MNDEQKQKVMAGLVIVTILYLFVCYPATQCFLMLMGIL